MGRERGRYRLNRFFPAPQTGQSQPAELAHGSVEIALTHFLSILLSPLQTMQGRLGVGVPIGHGPDQIGSTVPRIPLERLSHVIAGLLQAACADSAPGPAAQSCPPGARGAVRMLAQNAGQSFDLGQGTGVNQFPELDQGQASPANLPTDQVVEIEQADDQKKLLSDGHPAILARPWVPRPDRCPCLPSA